MASLYNINTDLSLIFDEIEANGGEITDEQSEALQIKKEELKEKLESYRQAIVMWKGAIETCKAESKRINDLKKTLENRVGVLTNAMKYAVENFGDAGKSGNYSFSLPTSKLYTRNTKRTVVDSQRITDLLTAVNSVVQMSIYGLADKNKAILLDWINDEYRKTHRGGKPFNLDDIKNINIKTTIKYNLLDWLWDNDATQVYRDNDTSELIDATTTDDWKVTLLADEYANPTVAKIENNSTLIVK